MASALDPWLLLRPSCVDEVDNQLRGLWPYREIDPTVPMRVDALLDQRLVFMRWADLLQGAAGAR